MSKIKVTHKDSFIYVSSKLDRKETLNFEEIDILEKANIRGFMRLYQEKNRKLFYRAPEAIPLFACRQHLMASGKNQMDNSDNGSFLDRAFSKSVIFL